MKEAEVPVRVSRRPTRGPAAYGGFTGASAQRALTLQLVRRLAVHVDEHGRADGQDDDGHGGRGKGHGLDGVGGRQQAAQADGQRQQHHGGHQRLVEGAQLLTVDAGGAVALYDPQECHVGEVQVPDHVDNGQHLRRQRQAGDGR